MRDNRIEIRVSKIEKEKLFLYSQKENRTISDFIRLRIFDENSNIVNSKLGKLVERDKKTSVWIRCTKEEKIILEQHAKERNLTIPEYIRLTSIYNQPLIDKNILQNIYRELHHQGTNLNQFVKRLNSKKQNDIDPQETEEILSKVKTSIDKLNSILSDTKN